MTVLDILKRFFQTLVQAFSGKPRKTTLDPSELTGAVLNAANEGAKDWDDQLDLPNSFEVRIPRDEWDSYYGSRIRHTEDRLAHALLQFASEIGATMEEPLVTVMVGNDVPRGEVSVSASFSTPSDLPVTPALSKGEGGKNGGEDKRWTSTPVLVDDSARDVLHQSEPSVAACTPRVSHLIARISVPGGPCFEVSEGSTVGIVRDPSRERPTICLPYSEALYYAAQVQGEFQYGDGGWSFVNKGRNGTSVRRGSEITQIDEHPFILKDNDMLYFGTPDAPALIFSTKTA